MSKNLKERIIIVARDLFDKYGYNGVSMRDIADELKISVGNLTYHYKKKEDLIESVVMEKHKNYIKAKPPKNLEELDDLFNRILDNQRENSYYFKHYNQLAQISSNIYNAQLNVIKDLHEALSDGFLNLQKSNLMINEDIPGLLNSVIQSIITVCVYRLPNIISFEEESDYDSAINCLWSIVYMYLTDSGKEIYRENLKK